MQCPGRVATAEPSLRWSQSGVLGVDEAEELMERVESGQVLRLVDIRYGEVLRMGV